MGRDDEAGPYRRPNRPRAAEGGLVTLRRYTDVLSAETDRASLEAAGIAAHVIEGASFNPALASAIGAVRLEVASGDVDDATEVLGVSTREESESDNEVAGTVRCPRCELAYCNFERPQLRSVAPGIAFLLLPFTFFFGKKRWRCQKCLHAWDDATEGPKAITKLAEGDPRPTFRLRRSRAGLGAFLGLWFGLLVAVLAGARPPLLFALLAAVVFGVVGRALRHAVCSVPDCRAPLPPGAESCPGCRSAIAGEIERASEHFSSAADVRRELAEAHADEARDAVVRKAKPKTKPKTKSKTTVAEAKAASPSKPSTDAKAEPAATPTSDAKSASSADVDATSKSDSKAASDAAPDELEADAASDAEGVSDEAPRVDQSGG